MNPRKTAVYAASTVIIFMAFASVYFLVIRPERVTSHAPVEGEKVLLFKDVKYTGEKKGAVNWEVRAKLVRKYIDKPEVQMEGIEGECRPKPDAVVSFRGSKGWMDTAEGKRKGRGRGGLLQGGIRDQEQFHGL